VSFTVVDAEKYRIELEDKIKMQTI